jgi:hypothetical protein
MTKARRTRTTPSSGRNKASSGTSSRQRKAAAAAAEQLAAAFPIDPLQAYVEAANPAWGFATLEDLVTSPEGFGLVDATPLQRAILRIIEGRPLATGAAPPPRSATAVPSAVRGSRRWFFASATRCGKSLIAAAIALRAPRTATFAVRGEASTRGSP